MIKTLFTSLVICSLLPFHFSCSTKPAPESLQPKLINSVKIKYENIPFGEIPDWIGGSESFPAYFDSHGNQILTPLKGFDTVPITKRTINNQGQIVYPHDGFQLIGDMKTVEFQELAKFAITLKNSVKINLKPLIIIADSNFPEKGAKITTPENKLLAEFTFQQSTWLRKK